MKGIIIYQIKQESKRQRERDGKSVGDNEKNLINYLHKSLKNWLKWKLIDMKNENANVISFAGHKLSLIIIKLIVFI